MSGTALPAGCRAPSESALAEDVDESLDEDTDRILASTGATSLGRGSFKAEVEARSGEEGTEWLSADGTSGNEAVGVATASPDKIGVSNGVTAGSAPAAPPGGVVGGVEGGRPMFTGSGMPRATGSWPKSGGTDVLGRGEPGSAVRRQVGIVD